MTYTTIGEIVLSEIRKDILSGKLTPGTKLDQNQLKERFGVSVIPLREALKRLQSEGYVDIVPHRGVRVKPLCREEIEDLYLVRAEIEALAARLALDKLSDADIEELKKLFEQMSKLTAGRAYKRVLNLNHRFHYIIYRACGHRHLLEMLDDLWNRSSRYRNLVTVRPSRARQAIEEHRRILDACIKRDPVALSEAIRHNIDETRKTLGEAPDSEHFPLSSGTTLEEEALV